MWSEEGADRSEKSGTGYGAWKSEETHLKKKVMIRQPRCNVIDRIRKMGGGMKGNKSGDRQEAALCGFGE